MIIPDTANEKPMAGLAVAVGTGKTGDDGKKVPIEVKKGDHVPVSKFGGTEIKLEGKDYRILNNDDILSVNIVMRAIEEPMRPLPKNAGVEGSVVVQEVKRRKENEGYNVATNEYEDLVKAGVVDPKKVSRAALQNAGPIAGLLLTTECLVTEIPAEEKSGSALGGQGGMDY